MKPGTKPTPAIDRLMARVIESPGPLDTPCWIPTYIAGRDGYVVVTTQGRHMAAHRLTYQHDRGPIPAGLQIDHLCRVRKCCNPAHLETVTAAENLRRGMSPAWVAVRTNTCKRGHSLCDAYVDPSGFRRCRTCTSDYARDRNAANSGTCLDCEGRTYKKIAKRCRPCQLAEIGSESNPAAFLDTLLGLTAEWGRVLAPHGSLAIELGDTYASSGGVSDTSSSMSAAVLRSTSSGTGPNKLRDAPGWPLAKSLALIPQLATLILMMCPREVCRVCGEPLRRITDVCQVLSRKFRDDRPTYDPLSPANGYNIRASRSDTTTGWTDCGHDDYRPGLVLDPFAGSGTTLATADLHGRDAIGIDIDERNRDIYPARYDEVKRALYGTPPPMPGQGDLFAEVAG